MSTSTTQEKPKRPLSEKQLAARRLNAQKSTGPRTLEGKARSSLNARKHGFFTQTALLFYEAPEDFVALRDSYIDEYQPQSPTEMHFVMEMANAQFRLRRVRGMEADLFQILITRELPSRSLSNGEMQAQAFRTLADTSNALHLLQRYEVMFRRQYERALRMLWEHRDRQRELSAPATPSQPQNRNFTKRTETRPAQTEPRGSSPKGCDRAVINPPQPSNTHPRAAGAASPPHAPADFPSPQNSPRARARATAAAPAAATDSSQGLHPNCVTHALSSGFPAALALGFPLGLGRGLHPNCARFSLSLGQRLHPICAPSRKPLPLNPLQNPKKQFCETNRNPPLTHLHPQWYPGRQASTIQPKAQG
jgi:hypothetical protein